MSRHAAVSVFAALAAAAFAAGASQDLRVTTPPPEQVAVGSRGFVCPMHPQHVSDRSADCPACGMRLVPATARGGDSVSVPGAVRVGTEARQLAGVTLVEVTEAPSSHTYRLAGRVVADESRTYTVTAGVEGFVRDVDAVTTGSRVRKGQRLAVFSAPDAIPALQNYVVAVQAMERLRGQGREGEAQAQVTATSANFQQRFEKLRDLGVSEAQIAEIGRTGAVPDGIRIVAPADGVVLARNIFRGQRFQRGTDWFRMADLERVWVLAQVVGSEADHVRPGLHARIAAPGRAGELEGVVAGIEPQFDPGLRALEVRLEVRNLDLVLRPDMFVDVELRITLPPTITVPTGAVLDTGLEKTVFVDRGEGVLEPRRVQTGWRHGGRVQVLDGLAAGESVVASGTFLIDSESRMEAALARFGSRAGS